VRDKISVGTVFVELTTPSQSPTIFLEIRPLTVFGKTRRQECTRQSQSVL